MNNLRSAAVRPDGSPVSLATVSSPEASIRSTRTAEPTSLERLRSATRPPADDVSYTLPGLSRADAGRFAELDARIAYLRTQGYAEPEEDIVEMVHEQHCRSLMATRELVQEFLNDGICPSDLSESKALALFLLTNRLFNGLTWLVAQSGRDMLDLHRCELGNDGIAMVAEWAGALPFTVELVLSNNHVDAAGARRLAEALQAATIVALDLGLNPLGDEGVQLLCEGLAHDTGLRSLRLQHVDGADAAMEAVAGLLESHSTLAVLDVSVNRFGDAAAGRLAAALRCNRTLRSVCIEHVEASDAGLSIVVSALKANTALRTMRASLAEPEHVQLPFALAEALAENETLVHLEVLLGRITDAAAGALAVAVANNTGLRTFKCRLAAYGLTEENAAAVRRIKDKVKANALVGAAGAALVDLSQMVPSPVRMPFDVSCKIAAFAAQVAADDGRVTAMQSIVKAGRTGRQTTEGEGGEGGDVGE